MQGGVPEASEDPQQCGERGDLLVRGKWEKETRKEGTKREGGVKGGAGKSEESP